MKTKPEFENLKKLTFSEAFYGTYKLDKVDGKPHLKEGMFHPFSDVWLILFMCSAVVGSIMLALMLSMQFQYFRNAKLCPEWYDPPIWQDYIMLVSFGIAFIATFLCIIIPRVFFCKGAMWSGFISSMVILNAAQIFSHYASGLSVFTFSFGTFFKSILLILSGCFETYLYSGGICIYAVGLTAMINYFVAKHRIYQFNKYKASR